MADKVGAATPVQYCRECGMVCDPTEYHPYAACLMYKACHDSETVRANLADQSALAAANEKHRFGSCEVCWNMAWVPCPESEPNAVPMKCSNGTTYWRCDYCWMKQQLAAARAEGKREGLEVAARVADSFPWSRGPRHTNPLFIGRREGEKTATERITKMIREEIDLLAAVPPQPTPGGE